MASVIPIFSSESIHPAEPIVFYATEGMQEAYSDKLSLKVKLKVIPSNKKPGATIKIHIKNRPYNGQNPFCFLNRSKTLKKAAPSSVSNGTEITIPFKLIANLNVIGNLPDPQYRVRIVVIAISDDKILQEIEFKFKVVYTNKTNYLSNVYNLI